MWLKLVLIFIFFLINFWRFFCSQYHFFKSPTHSKSSFCCFLYLPAKLFIFFIIDDVACLYSFLVNEKKMQSSLHNLHLFFIQTCWQQTSNEFLFLIINHNFKLRWNQKNTHCCLKGKLGNVEWKLNVILKSGPKCWNENARSKIKTRRLIWRS